MSTIEIKVQKKYEEYPLQTKVKLIVTTELYNQMLYLCKKISEVEWSGVLFYHVKGSITDLGNMVLTAKYIYPMHKGTSGYTEYDFSSDVLDVYDTRKEFLGNGHKYGHIHSHNNMRVFFSGTDMQELHDNVEFYNYYVSLIVNNKMEMTAKICFVAKSKGATLTMLGDKGEEAAMEIEGGEYLVTADCDISIQIADKLFYDRTNKIIEDASKASTRVPSYGYTQTTYPKVNRGPGKQIEIPLGLTGQDLHRWLAENSDTKKEDSFSDKQYESFLVKLLNLDNLAEGDLDFHLTKIVKQLTTGQEREFWLELITDKFEEFHDDSFGMSCNNEDMSNTISKCTKILEHYIHMEAVDEIIEALDLADPGDAFDEIEFGTFSGRDKKSKKDDKFKIN